MRTLAFALAAGAAAVLAAPAAAADAVTTRIETRPFYGAIVTLEQGVRVFRPLPRHDRIIINPGGQTPLSLGYAESYNYSYNQYSGDGGAPGAYYAPEYYDGFGNVVPRRGRFHHRRSGGQGHQSGGSHGVR
jgi:opacity protein-like surface antigen